MLGTLAEGVDLSCLFGCTKTAIDKFTFANNTTTYNTPLSHSFGSKPKFALALASKEPMVVGGIIMTFVGKEEWETEYYDCRMICKYNEGYGRFSWNVTPVTGIVSESTLQFGDSTATAKKFAAGVEYTLITVG